MKISCASNDQPPAQMVAAALAHLACHMATGCQRSAYLAAMLLERLANDEDADSHLRNHARELASILERDGGNTLPQEPVVQHLPLTPVKRTAGAAML